MGAAFAFGTIVYTSVNPDTMTVGDRITLTISILAPQDATITPPDIQKSIGKFTLKDLSTTKTSLKNADSLTYTYVLTLYTVEPCTIPALTFLQTKQATTDTLLSQAYPIRVSSVVTGDTVDIKDLKPLQSAGKAPLWWLWITCGFIGVAAILFLWSRRKKKIEMVNAAAALLPPYEEAILALETLLSKGFLSIGLIREYTFAVSDIIKRYIERSFSIPASEYTTEEMLCWIEIAPLPADEKNRLSWFFKTTDPVKFARSIPAMEILTRFSGDARAFFDATRPSPIAAAQNKGAAASSAPSTGASPGIGKEP